MKATNWENALKDLRHRLDLIQSRAHEDSVRFEELREQIESTKIRFLAYQFDTRRKHLAHSRGLESLAENKKSLPIALGMAAVGSILTGIMTRDGIAAANAGKRGLRGALMRLGETDWAVCLGKHLAVASENHITRDDVWVTWGSLQTALHELEERAKSGAPLGSLYNIISELKKSNKLLFVIRLSKDRTAVQF